MNDISLETIQNYLTQTEFELKPSQGSLMLARIEKDN
jgi:hypothetical protein